MSDQEKPCAICDAEDVDPERIVFRDDLWAAEVLPGYEVPGWFILRNRRHAEKITGLTEEEIAGFGHRTRDLTAAITEVTGAPTTYLLSFGENYTHFHILMTARTDDWPADRRGADMVKSRTEVTDPSIALALVPAVRAAYAEASAGSLAR